MVSTHVGFFGLMWHHGVQLRKPTGPIEITPNERWGAVPHADKSHGQPRNAVDTALGVRR